MADNIRGKVWSLDTVVAVVSTNDVCIHSIRVRFTTAGIGSCVITAFRPDVAGANNVAETLIDLKTTAASTAAAWLLDQQYTFGDQTFKGLVKSVSVNIDTIYVVTGVPK